MSARSEGPGERERPARQRPGETYRHLSQRQRTVVAAAAMVVMIAFGFLLLPFDAEVDGVAVACGSPLTPAPLEAGSPAAEACNDGAGARQVAAGAVVVVTVVTAFGVRAWLARRENP